MFQLNLMSTVRGYIRTCLALVLLMKNAEAQG